MRIRLALPAVLFLALFIPSTAAANQAPASCSKTYTRAMFHSAARSTFRHATVPTLKRHRLRKIVRCQRRAVSRRIVRRSLKRYKAKHARRYYWQVRFHRLPAVGQSWAYSTAHCESTMNQRAYNPAGPWYSYFQWSLSTWAAAGGVGHPYGASFYHQAVLAWPWHVSHPSGQWPVCGE